jgi:hypothetical protein
MKYKVYDLNTQVELISKSFTYDGYEKGLGGTSGQAWFGCQKQSQPKRAYGGNIGEFIMCDGELNENDIEKVETYLKNKWK